MFNLNDGLLYSGILTFSEEWQVTLVYLISAIAVIAVSYLLGSVNSAIIISKTFYNDDIRNHGSGNAGLTNVNRTYGLKAAGLTLLGDMLKSLLSVLFAALLFGFHYIDGISISEFCYVAGLFAVLGHVFPIYYGFKGGKGVLSTATVALVLAPIPFAILFALFVAIVAISKYVSLGSVCVATLFPVIVNGYIKVFLGGMPNGILSLSTIILAILVVWCHRENLKRISDRTERKLSFKKKDVEVKKDDEDEA
jgi:glycerol-3-phosphate acyltransferase PlsY